MESNMTQSTGKPTTTTRATTIAYAQASGDSITKTQVEEAMQDIEAQAAAKIDAKKATKKVAKKATKKAAAKKVEKKAAKKAAKKVAKKAAAKKASAKQATAKKAAKKATKTATKAAKKVAKKATAKKAAKKAAQSTAFDDLDDDFIDDDSVEDIPEPQPARRGAKKSARGAGGGRDVFGGRGQLTPEEQESRRNRLKALIKLGKERGYLTYGEINDHLPDDLVDADAIERIITTFGDMGISVYDQAPDAETLLMSDGVTVISADDDVEEEADAALTTVDADFGRTTDPVRMYMREMGSVELLTREGEIEIAKRIEDGLKDMVMAIAACPTTVNEVLAYINEVREGNMPIDDVVDGLIDDDGEEYAGAGAKSEEGEEGPAGGMSSSQLEYLREKSLKKFALIQERFDKMRVAYDAEGYDSEGDIEAREKILEEFMGTRVAAQMGEKESDTIHR